MVVASRISLSESPFSSLDQLLQLPPRENNRAFDVFYHLLLAENEHYGEFLSLKSSPDQYDLLKKSKTYNLPSWITYSDDYALAKDWSDGLRQCGFKGATLRGVLSTLSGILLLGNSSNSDDTVEACSMLGIDPANLKNHSTEQLIASSYTSLVENVVAELNNFLATHDIRDSNAEAQGENDVVSVVTMVECNPTTDKQVILKNVFDNSTGINNELKDDGIVLPKSPASVMKSLASQSQLSALSSHVPDPIDGFRSTLDGSVSYIATKPASVSPVPVDGESPLDVAALCASTRVWNVLNVSPSADAVSQSADTWSSALVSSQIREFYVTEWAQKRRTIDFTADFGFEEFLEKYSPIMPPSVGFYELESWARNDKSWGPNEFYLGSHRIWLSEDVWRELEVAIESLGMPGAAGPFADAASFRGAPPTVGGYDAPDDYDPSQPTDRLLPGGDIDNQSRRRRRTGGVGAAANPFGDRANSSTYDRSLDSEDEEGDDMDLYNENYVRRYQDDIEVTGADSKEVKSEVKTMTSERRAWVWFVWMLTFWIPSAFLKYVLRMKRQQVRIAWREKLVICFIIFLFNAGIIFYMMFLGNLICPDFDKVWSSKEVGTHQGTDDYYVSIWGNVYDMTKFYKKQHSDLPGVKTSSATMMEFAGDDLSQYFFPPLTVACPDLVTDDTIELPRNTTAYPSSQADHASGPYAQPVESTKLHNITWFNDVFTPGVKKYYKGRLVESKDWIKKKADAGSYIVIIDDEFYNLDTYFKLTDTYDESYSSAYAKYNFLPSTFVSLVEDKVGQDITKDMKEKLDATTRSQVMKCLDNTFKGGKIDFRYSARCQTANYILLVIAGILTSVTAVKFLASLRFGGKKVPSPQDKFVVCQIPAYTESEEALRLAIDSLTSLKYDNRRKLLFVICDGMIVGAGNDRPTPRIVLDLFGVDEKLDPPKLPYLSIGEGANRLNYAQVYSGLYENEGYIVPYIVVSKCGRPDETSRPGNRGKRDSQILLMNFFNKVQYQRPMNPVELEIFHQLNNVVGVDPELYEYILMVDADTSVAEDALTRLVSACTNDAKIAGTCGETGLQNEEQSWTTMMQVYEYFISHHLTKAFESLFGTVTCLPGCFSLYRMRTPKKCKPLIISDEVIRDYSVLDVDTLHKKNLFSLGEDRYLTTLLTKHFSKMKLTFVADAHAYTAAPDELKVLLSQRRRWINSTVHNLVELLRLNNMCGFCIVGMRGIVFIDLIGTMMLPSVVVYLGYLIYRIASHTGPLPLISIVLIASVYGLQMLVFVLRRQWQHIGWMIFYLAAYPVHSFLLPIYSFWNMDNFSWGNTRVVVEEKGKQHVIEKDAGFDPSVVQEETWHSYASRLGLPGAERTIVFHERKGRIIQDVAPDEGYDMQELTPYGKSIYGDQFTERASTMAPGIDPSVYSAPPPVGQTEDYRASRSFAVGAAESIGGRPGTLMGAVGPSDMSMAGGDDGFDEERERNVRETISHVLSDADLDNMTKRQLREKVEDILGVQFSGSKIEVVDRMIDEELERLDEEDDA